MFLLPLKGDDFKTCRGFSKGTDAAKYFINDKKSKPKPKMNDVKKLPRISTKSIINIQRILDNECQMKL